MKSIGVIGVVFAGVAAVLAADPLQQVPPGQAQFRAAVDLVQVDVSVLDRDRRPVRGLTVADFTILENGQPQIVEAFAEIDIPPPVEPASPWMKDVAPDVRRNDDFDDRRLVVIVLDDGAIYRDVWAIQTTTRLARSVIDRLGSTDLAAVVFTRDNRHAQDFTTDRARLLAAVEKFTVGFRGMGNDILYHLYTADTMRRAAEYLVEVPHRRKAIIYIGNGVPCDLGASCDGQLKDRLELMFRRAQEANVNVYLLDVCGLRAQNVIGNTCQPGPEIEFMHTTALNTGGRAIVDTNDLMPGLTEIFQSMSSYYLLGYRSPNPTADGNFRRLEVKVNRPGSQVISRNGYWAPKARDVVRGAETSPLRLAISGLLPKGDLPLQVVATPFRIALPRGAAQTTLMVVLGVRQQIGERQMRTVESVDLQIEAFTPEGRSVASEQVRTEVTLRPGDAGPIGYEVLSRLTLRPGRYQLRLAARTERDGRTGSVYYDVDVPDYGRDDLAMSGIVLSAAPGIVSAPRDAIKGLMPVVPTSQRDFLPTDRVTAFVQMYSMRLGLAQPVVLTTRITDSAGRTVQERTTRLDARDFGAGRSADVQLDIPVATLPRDSYLLTVEASMETVTRQRHLRFRVR